MNGFDAAVVAVVLAFAGIGALRGAVGEVLALIAWVAAGVLAWWLHDAVAAVFSERLSDPRLRQWVASASIFAVAFGALSVAGFLLRKFVFVAALTGGARAFGAALGALRGVAVVVALTVLAGLTRFPQASWWRSATLTPPLESLARQAVHALPVEVARHFRYQ